MRWGWQGAGAAAGPSWAGGGTVGLACGSDLPLCAWFMVHACCLRPPRADMTNAARAPPRPAPLPAGCGGAAHWQLEAENYEGWRVRVAEGDGKEGWLLLRPSLHDPGGWRGAASGARAGLAVCCAAGVCS